LASLVAAVSAVALLVGVPAGVSIGLALADGQRIVGAIRLASLGLDLLTGCAWAGLFLAIQRLPGRYAPVRSALLSVIAFSIAFTVGVFGFYGIEPWQDRALLSVQYAVLVVLALWLFGFLASWLPSPEATPQHR
jgi:hypothetical protein